MASKYRALLIGNSTYPADEHNLQQLKGPVKDIAVLNRALVDPKTGLFDDVDVTLLPEASANRAVARWAGSSEGQTETMFCSSTSAGTASSICTVDCIYACKTQKARICSPPQ